MSDSSSLSSAPSSDDERLKAPKTLTLKKGKLTAGRPRKTKVTAPLSPERSPSPPPREASPPHEYVLADNPDIAVLVAFRARFNEAFPKHVPNVGPQDIENGIASDEPSEQVEIFLCALLALVLNRKKVIERGHHGRALEEAIQTQKSQWPAEWNGTNPLHGNQSFATMKATERLTLLKSLITWSLTTSDVISGIIRESYKQSRREDDVNQPLSVQSWGSDGRKRRYWLIEGQNDTPFRLYLENQPKLIKRTWWSIAGTLDDLREVGQNLMQEGSQADRRLAEKITASIPRLEQSEEKRKRREYKRSRRAAFTRPEPGFSLYEGRTRGKRMRYTFSDDEEEGSDTLSARRSARQSNRSTPAEFGGPTVTSSGRQVRSRFGRTYGEPMDTATNTPTEFISGYGSEASNRLRGGSGGPRRSGRARNTNQLRASNRRGEYDSTDELDDEGEAASTSNDWDGDDDDIEGKLDDEEDDEEAEDAPDTSDDESEDPLTATHAQSLIVQLKYTKDTAKPSADNTQVGRSSEQGVRSNNTESVNGSVKVEYLQAPNTASPPPVSTETKPEAQLPSHLPMTMSISQRETPRSKLGERASSPEQQTYIASNSVAILNQNQLNADDKPHLARAQPSKQYLNGLHHSNQSDLVQPLAQTAGSPIIDQT